MLAAVGTWCFAFQLTKNPEEFRKWLKAVVGTVDTQACSEQADNKSMHGAVPGSQPSVRNKHVASSNKVCQFTGPDYYLSTEHSLQS